MGRCRYQTMPLGAVLGLVAGVGWPAAVACGQAQPPGEQELESAAQPPPPKSREVRFAVSGGAEHQLETSIDGGGDFSVSRFNAGLGVQTNLSDELGLSLRFNYNLDLYEFDQTPFALAAGVEPWDDIHTTGAAAILTLQLSEDWSVFGGPVAQFARESGADWNDSFTAGGVAGATFRAASDLTIGGGVVVTSQLEANTRLSPIVIVNWQIAEDFRLASQTTSNASGRSGLELIYEAGHGWEVAVGGATQFSRFRLDDDGPVPRGVAEDESMPFWVRLSHGVNTRMRLDVVAGINAGGEFNVDDENGDRVAKEDYDPAAFFGVFGTFRF